ncbi:hypothetical protein H257_06356 [Aphanomyces astaci]|uniref:DDHD domain-containing protein n=1 Tax=Aphanomyces astaci TaxID=112090 RepID=W4GMG6_APHAT|nr:hypothetical protein H257_06356 [Aphanomyces astaci]ETV80905.1 hypothetical protein H257_06356 [Aphanomyces astaci]|eukprot:XP_009829852.1 hypothetical protein H257_06356 [Aphanomyces astaci]
MTIPEECWCPCANVSIFAHSLGSVIAYDLLTHGPGVVSSTGMRFPGLDSPSKTSLPLVPRSDHTLGARRRRIGSPERCYSLFHFGETRPKCNYYLNFIHPSDPVAYRVEPLLCHSPTASSVSLSTLFDPKDLHGMPFIDLYTRFRSSVSKPTSTMAAP